MTGGRARAGSLGYAVIGVLLLVVVGLLLAPVAVTGFFDRRDEPTKKVVEPIGPR